MQQLRYEGPHLDDLLARVQADHGSAAKILSADRSRRGGVGGFFAKEVFEVIVEVATGADGGEHPPGPTPADGVGEVDAPDTGNATGAARAARSDGGAAPTLLDVRESPDEFAALLSSLIAEDRPTAPVEPAAPIRFDPPIDLRVDRPTASAPTASVRTASATPRPVATGPVTLDRLFDQAESQVLPAPPLPHGGVVCVVGTKVEATRTAMVLARSIGQQLDEVVVIPSRTTDQLAPESVAVFVDELRRRNAARTDRRGPVIIVIELVAVLDGYRWVNHVLAVLHPQQIRLAATARWLLREIDNVRAAVASPSVLDVWEIGDLADPQRLLDTAVPIGTVDGAMSTVALWAAVLLAARHGGPASSHTSSAAGAPVVASPLAPSATR